MIQYQHWLNLERELQKLETDTFVTLHLIGGHNVSGFLNEWDWGAGLINLRTFPGSNTRQMWVPAPAVVAFTANFPEKAS